MVKAMAQLRAAINAEKLSAEKSLTFRMQLAGAEQLVAQAQRIVREVGATATLKIPVQAVQQPGSQAPGASGVGAGMLGGLVGIGTVYTAVAALKGLGQELVQTANTALKLNTSTDSIQRLGIMARISGEDVSTVSSALIKLERSLFGSTKDAAMEQAFHSLGIDARSFIGLAPEQQVITLAQALQRADKDGRGTVEMYELLSKKAEGLLPVLRQNVDELKKLGARSVISAEDVADAKRLKDAYEEAWDVAKRWSTWALTHSVGATIYKSLQPESEDDMKVGGESPKEKAFREAELQEHMKRARRTVEVETERAKKMDPISRGLSLEMAVSAAKAQRSGGADINPKIIEELEDELKVLALQKQYKEDFKLNDQHALQLARQRVGLERTAITADQSEKLDVSRQQLGLEMALANVRERRANGEDIGTQITDQLEDQVKFLSLQKQYKESMRLTDKEAADLARAVISQNRAALDAEKAEKIKFATQELDGQDAINLAKIAAVNTGQGEVNALEDALSVLRLQKQIKEQLNISDDAALAKAQAMVANQRALQNALNAQANGDHNAGAAAAHARANGQGFKADKIEREQEITKTTRELLKTNPGMDPKVARRQAEGEQRDKDKIAGRPAIIRGYTGPSGIGQGNGLDAFNRANYRALHLKPPGFMGPQAPNPAAAKAAQNAQAAAQKAVVPDPRAQHEQEVLTTLKAIEAKLNFAN